MAKIVETYPGHTSAKISEKTGISMPTLQRYKKLYQDRVQGAADAPRAEDKKKAEVRQPRRLVIRGVQDKKSKVKMRQPQRHVTRGASASEIRRALGISKKELDAARRDLATLHLKHKDL